MEDSFKFRVIRFPQRSGFMFPHEFEAQRIKTAMLFANWTGIVACVVLLAGLASGDLAPFFIVGLMYAVMWSRAKWLEYRLAKFMEGSGL